jgi:tetratricopeptide (TPR) repeat protein
VRASIVDFTALPLLSVFVFSSCKTLPHSVRGLLVEHLVIFIAVDSRPIQRARVEFLNESTGWAASTLTDQDGRFSFTGLSPTNYQVTVTAPGCELFGTTLKVEGSTAPLVLHMHKTEQPSAPRNDSVVSVQELKMSDKAETPFAKGTKLLQKGAFRESIAYLQRAIAKDPGYYRAYHNLGLAYYQLGQVAEAEQAFQKSIDATDGGYAPSQFALAMILCQDREFHQAERLIQNGLAMEPGSALGKYFLALVQFALNRPAEAEKSARDALWRNANQAEAHILLAKIHEREHHPYAVVTDVAAYLKLDPHGPLENEASTLLGRAQLEISQNAVTNH